jgi:ubiquinone/menaquinone biosynthesis C-methylase UbiE
MAGNLHRHHDHQERDFLPGVPVGWLTPLYDLIGTLAGTGREHRTLLRHAGIAPGDRVLEVGCGTGMLTVLAKKRHPDAELTGVDPDERALERARRKGGSLGIRFDHGYGQRLAYPDASFDRVLSAFMLHHLEGDDRDASLREVRRVLRPGGALYLVDLGGHVHETDGFRARRQLRSRMLHDNLGEAIPGSLRAAGFSQVDLLGSGVARLGPVSHYRALR